MDLVFGDLKISRDGSPKLKQTANWFEANFHVRGIDSTLKQPFLVQQGEKELLPD